MMDCRMIHVYWKEGCWGKQEKKKNYTDLKEAAEDTSVWRTIRRDCHKPASQADNYYYYEDIVNALETVANKTIVKLPCSALKVFWTSELDCLKQDSIFCSYRVHRHKQSSSLVQKTLRINEDTVEPSLVPVRELISKHARY